MVKTMRIGHGYDVHKLVKNRPFILGTVRIPYEKGLLGHSDADVLLHAVCDALLGAAALGDIGLHFPDSDDTYKDCPSDFLLREVCKKIAQNGFHICNIDATILLQKPRLRPYIEKMREAVAKICYLKKEDVNIKATTEEGLGFTGSGEGIAAHAVCLIEKI